MITQTTTNGAPTLAGSGPTREALTPAERYARDRAELKSHDPEVRKAAAVRLVESGSSAVYPLLRAVADDKCKEVREAAIWSLLWLTGDFLGENREEYDSIARLLKSSSTKDRHLQVGMHALWMEFQGESAAGSAAGRLTDIDGPSRNAGLRFLRGMVQEAPNIGPELPGVLRLIKWHLLPSVRRAGSELTQRLSTQQSTNAQTERGTFFEALLRRRTRVETADSLPNEDLFRMMSSDPDRAVRHLAAAKLFARVSEGVEVPVPAGHALKDREVRYLFVEGTTKLCVHPNVVKSFESLLTAPRARTRQCALTLLIHLRPALDDDTASAIDKLVRDAMRDKEREVRRCATAVAKVASTDYTQAELAGRLREQLRRHPPLLIPIFIGAQAVLFTSTTFFLPKWYGLAPHLLNLVFCVYTFLRDRAGEHGITHDECLETLCAMEPLAETAPEKLRHSLPELRKLSGRTELDSEVRAKAREMLDKVQKAMSHELPIAATGPAVEPAALPIPGAAPEVREVTVR